jgi:hypothetical protein
MAKSKPPKASQGKSRLQARRQRVAAAVVAGVPVAKIARGERVSRATASRVANSPEVRLLITALVEAQGEKIRALFAKGLDVIDESFAAMKPDVVTEKAVIAGGPDHYARLTGVKCLTALLTAGRQAQKPEPPAKKTLTLEELTALAEVQTAGLM